MTTTWTCFALPKRIAFVLLIQFQACVSLWTSFPRTSCGLLLFASAARPTAAGDGQLQQHQPGEGEEQEQEEHALEPLRERMRRFRGELMRRDTDGHPVLFWLAAPAAAMEKGREPVSEGFCDATSVTATRSPRTSSSTWADAGREREFELKVFASRGHRSEGSASGASVTTGREDFTSDDEDVVGEDEDGKKTPLKMSPGRGNSTDRLISSPEARSSSSRRSSKATSSPNSGRTVEDAIAGPYFSKWSTLAENTGTSRSEVGKTSDNDQQEQVSTSRGPVVSGSGTGRELAWCYLRLAIDGDVSRASDSSLRFPGPPLSISGEEHERGRIMHTFVITRGAEMVERRQAEQADEDATPKSTHEDENSTPTTFRCTAAQERFCLQSAVDLADERDADYAYRRGWTLVLLTILVALLLLIVGLILCWCGVCGFCCRVNRRQPKMDRRGERKNRQSSSKSKSKGRAVRRQFDERTRKPSRDSEGYSNCHSEVEDSVDKGSPADCFVRGLRSAPVLSYGQGGEPALRRSSYAETEDTEISGSRSEHDPTIRGFTYVGTPAAPDIVDGPPLRLVSGEEGGTSSRCCAPDAATAENQNSWGNGSRSPSTSLHIIPPLEQTQTSFKAHTNCSNSPPRPASPPTSSVGHNQDQHGAVGRATTGEIKCQNQQTSSCLFSKDITPASIVDRDVDDHDEQELVQEHGTRGEKCGAASPSRRGRTSTSLTGPPSEQVAMASTTGEDRLEEMEALPKEVSRPLALVEGGDDAEDGAGDHLMAGRVVGTGGGDKNKDYQ